MRHSLWSVRTLFSTVQCADLVSYASFSSHISNIEKKSQWNFFDTYSCGIVLCSRDAKFAVDCDTCRLSYCLVCLASGSKDPCVRCGHRPSKRMEQLVHLRLKSIYKAFKQSSRNSRGAETGDGGKDDDGDDDNLEGDNDDDTDGGKAGDPQSLLQAAASAASKHSGPNRSSASRHHQPDHQHFSQHGNTPVDTKARGNTPIPSRDQQAKDMVDKYRAEKEKADAAAEALRAELEEEEKVTRLKKSKKMRKKERERVKKEEEEREKKPVPNTTQRHTVKTDDEDSDIEIDDIAKLSSTRKNGSKEDGKKTNKKNCSSDNTMDVDKKIAGVESLLVERPKPKIDPIEQQLCEYIADSNYVGIEEILSDLRGVPGRALLRKNAKKALKKIKTEQIAIEEEAMLFRDKERAKKQGAENETKKSQSDQAAKEHQTRSPSMAGTGTPATHSETTESSGHFQPPLPLLPGELLRMVSYTSGNDTSHTTFNRNQRKQSALKSTSEGAKTECVMHISYHIVGWVIGKGGQRIRDLMEDSGAKVWIDQENLSEKDPRSLHVSGSRTNVDVAVKMVKELITKSPGAPAPAPIPAAATTTAPAIIAPVAASSNHLPSVNGSSFGCTETPNARGIATPLKSAPAASTLRRPVDTLFFTTDAPVKVSSEAQSMSQMGTPASRVDIFVQELKCEACFVPLLIGRRGWTIKHIQDSSGARVDIDQTVTPRKVKISGREECVHTAIRMVRDVLSYPHSQLQGASESSEELHLHTSNADPLAATAAHSNTTTVAASNQILNSAVIASPPVAMTTAAAVERVHSPPPSSHVNIGDAKSTISASSSLSSTPEPSMASTVKGHYSTVGTPGPLIPSEYGGAYAQQQHFTTTSSNLFVQQNNLPQMNLPNLPDCLGGTGVVVLPPQQQHVSPQLFPGGLAPPRLDTSPGLQTGFPHQQQAQQQHYQQQQRQQEFLGQSILRDQHQQQQYVSVSMRQMHELDATPLQAPHNQTRPNSLSRVEHLNSFPFPGRTQREQQSQLHLYQQNAFHSSESKSAVRHGIGTGRSVEIEGLSSDSAAFVPPGMWADGSMLLHGQRQPSIVTGLGGGASGVAQESLVSKGVTPLKSDDSKMIDSLFGPSESKSVNPIKDDILTGFQGLSLDDGLGSDMWGKDLSQPFDAPHQISPFLTTTHSDVAAPANDESQHPSKSRFGF